MLWESYYDNSIKPVLLKFVKSFKCINKKKVPSTQTVQYHLNILIVSYNEISDLLLIYHLEHPQEKKHQIFFLKIHNKIKYALHLGNFRYTQNLQLGDQIKP